MYKIMLVEDDRALASAMKKQLEAYSHEVICPEDLSDIIDTFVKESPQLVLMDIMLPFRDGYFWCSKIRKISKVPVVFISSASENMNIVMAIGMGGDDFIPKPVDPMVLCAKVNAILRRSYEMNGEYNMLEFHGAFLNLADNRVIYGENTAELTRNEYRILRTLVEHKGKIVSRDELMLQLWQDDLYVEENTLSVNIARLRKKLESCGLSDVIVTKTGSGYLIS